MLFPTVIIASLAAFATQASAAVTCAKIGDTVTATWKNAASQTCSWTGVIGSNFGTSPLNGGDYSCNGRCGAGCSGTAIGNAYTADCFSHDICSWFNGASGGIQRSELWGCVRRSGGRYITWGHQGCGQTNPTNAAAAPTTSPVCS